jgi:lipoyl synthase
MEIDYNQQRELIKKKRDNARAYAANKVHPNTHEKKPSWLKARIPSGDNFKQVKSELRQNNLWTVCEEASCPNLGECWEAKTATMMILGGTCTRACKFCHVDTGNPKGVVDEQEINNAAKMVDTMGLKYLVVTSVDRDDLSDFGAGHFSNVVTAISQRHPDTLVEVLIPDFDAVPSHMHTLAQSNPFVIAQNIETVKRLTKRVRDPRAGYEKTLKCLDFYKREYPHIATKTSIMLGLGEELSEVIDCLKDLRSVGVQIVTFGQYLRPTKNHLPVEKYWTPEEFLELKKIAYKLGFEFVASGPMVRSSYKAADYLKHLEAKGLWPRK